MEGEALGVVLAAPRAKPADFPSEEGYRAAAWMLGCEIAAMKAVGFVEAGHEGAFYDSPPYLPVILYERHVFDELTRGRFRGEKFGEYLLSWPEGGGWGPTSIQHKKLEAAAKLDRDAALRSCSWGLYQIMGKNHHAAGFPLLQRFINAMFRSADDHLRSLVLFIRNDAAKVDAIRGKNWADFARLYNGRGYKAYRYDEKLDAAYARIVAEEQEDQRNA